jgi:hypothetical protein
MYCTTTTKDMKEGSPPKKTQRKDNITTYIHTYIHTYKKERKKSNHSFQAFKNTYMKKKKEEKYLTSFFLCRRV